MTHSGVNDNARLVAESALEFARGIGGVARARSVRDQGTTLDLGTWNSIVELGWLGMGVPESQGGLGLGPEVMCALLESAGKMLLPEPLVSSIAAANLLAGCASDAATDALAELISGERRYVAVAAELATQDFPIPVAHVPDCFAGTGLLLAHGAGDAFQIRVLEPDGEDISMDVAECVDGSRLAGFTLSQAAWRRATPLAQGPSARAAFDRARDEMLLGYSAFMVGLMDEALQLTLAYMKLRVQFGAPIGAFQALQHRAASCHVDIVSCRALLYEAGTAFNTGARARAAAALKARTSACALRVTKECVQFHGAVGFADEHDIGLYLRKAVTLAARQGGEMEHKLRFARLGS